MNISTEHIRHNMQFSLNMCGTVKCLQCNMSIYTIYKSTNPQFQTSFGSSIVHCDPLGFLLPSSRKQGYCIRQSVACARKDYLLDCIVPRTTCGEKGLGISLLFFSTCIKPSVPVNVTSYMVRHYYAKLYPEIKTMTHFLLVNTCYNSKH